MYPPISRDLRPCLLETILPEILLSVSYTLGIFANTNEQCFKKMDYPRLYCNFFLKFEADITAELCTSRDSIQWKYTTQDITYAHLLSLCSEVAYEFLEEDQERCQCQVWKIINIHFK